MKKEERTPVEARPTQSHSSLNFDLEAHVNEFGVRVFVDAVLAATPAYWERRAAQFEAALPRPDDYPGRATPSERAERARQVKAKAEACRNAAKFWRAVHVGGGL